MSRISIIGSGVLGTAIGKGFLKHGHEVDFRDIDRELVHSYREGGYTARMLDEPFLENTDFYFLCVPTPTINGEADLQPLEQALRAVGASIRRQSSFPVVVVCSTVPVGTTGGLGKDTIEAVSGKRAYADFGLVSNPEYIRAGSAEADFQSPRIVLIGSEDETSARLVKELYEPFGSEIHVYSTQEAEAHKYIHNSFNATKISFFNELRSVLRDCNIRDDRILPLIALSAEGCWNPRYGIADWGPFGGQCLPKDLDAFLSWILEHGMTKTPLLEAVRAVNERIKGERKQHER